MRRQNLRCLLLILQLCVEGSPMHGRSILNFHSVKRMKQLAGLRPTEGVFAGYGEERDVTSKTINNKRQLHLRPYSHLSYV